MSLESMSGTSEIVEPPARPIVHWMAGTESATSPEYSVADGEGGRLALGRYGAAEQLLKSSSWCD